MEDKISIEKISNWRFKLRCPKEFREYFKYTSYEMKYNFKKKRYEKSPVESYLYLKEDTDGFIFGIGFAPYILFHFGGILDENSKVYCKDLNNDPLHVEFDELRESQLQDINDLLKFKRGVFQVYTGYGKTQIIAALVNYIVNIRNEYVLLLAPNSKSLQEIDVRLNSLYGITHTYFDYDSKFNAINVNGFPRSNVYDKSNPYWKKVKWILAEEVEYDVTGTGMEIIELCENCDRAYGYSATADKQDAKRIVMRDGNVPVVQRNKNVIHYFGFSTVYKKPDDFNITMVDIKTTILDNVLDEDDENSAYTEIIYSIFTDGTFCRGLANIAYKERLIYIPMMRLEVIDYWLRNYLNRKGYTVINISSRGYQVFIDGEFRGNISLEELKEYVKDDMVDIIVGTKSSYSALDLPELAKVMLLTSQLASNVLQAIGRVARTKEFTIINLVPYHYIRVYSNDLRKRKKLIKEYYSESKINYIKRTEIDYGIY